MYGAYERPPFPIKNDAPSWIDIFREMKFSDFFMGGTVYGIGMMYAYVAAKPFMLLMERMVVFHGISHLMGVISISMMIAVPYRRLTGYWDNGLRWKIPEDKLNKFDSTSHFEANTIWKRFRIRPDQ